MSGRAAIIEYGIDRFNDYCRPSCSARPTPGSATSTRQARWVDFDDDYKTMDLSFMESVMWAFKSLYDKGLIYEGYRVLPYCWECETPLSNFETRQDDAYRPREDPAVTVAFKLDPLEPARDRSRSVGAAPAARLDDDAVDAAVEPRPRRRCRHHLLPSTSWTGTSSCSPKPREAPTRELLGERRAGRRR